MNTLRELDEKLNNVLDSEGRNWLEHAKLQLAQSNGDIESLVNKLVFYTSSAKRKLGVVQLNGKVNSIFNSDKYGQCDKVYLNHWTVTDAARIILLAEIFSFNFFSTNELFQLCYRYSDGGERTSLLKGLPLLELKDQSINFLIDVARTNSLEIFSALVYKNPWVAVKFPVSAYNQIVLKSLFMGVNIIHLEGLRAARNSELGRMTADYVQERLDAGREIPESSWLAVDANLLTEQGLRAWESALQTKSSENTYLLAKLGCQWQADLPSRLKSILQSASNF
jgi:hypothetical protein